MIYLKEENNEYLDYMKFIDTEKNQEEDKFPEPQPKQCKLTARAKKIHKEKIIVLHITCGVQAIIDEHVSKRGVYSTFKNQLLISGLIKWHLNVGEKDICVLNDIN